MLLERRKPRGTANAALRGATTTVRDEANEEAEAVARAIDRIVRVRWGVFVRAKKLDAGLLLDGLDDEIRKAIEAALEKRAIGSASETMAEITKSVSGEALLAIHRKGKLLDLDESSVDVLDLREELRFVSKVSAAAKRAAYEFVKLPSKAEVRRLIYEPFKGETWLQRMKNWLPKEKAIAREIANGLSLGKSRQEIARALLPVMDGTRAQAMRLARTEVHRVNVTAQMRSVNQALGPAIEGWTFTATPGERTCPVCSKLDGKTYKKGDPKPRLPLHPGCRCVLRPSMKSWDSFGLPKSITDVIKQPFGGRAQGS